MNRRFFLRVSCLVAVVTTAAQAPGLAVTARANTAGASYGASSYGTASYGA